MLPQRYSPCASPSDEKTNKVSVARWFDKYKGKNVVVKTFDNEKDFRKELNFLSLTKGMTGIRMLDSIKEERIIIMEDGGQDLISAMNEKKFTGDEVKRNFRSIFYALLGFHSKGIFHGDIKLENIVIRKGGDLSLIDFGLSEVIPDNQKSDEVYGTRFYIAPETFLDKGHDLKADVYALGVTLFVCLTGEFPFTADNQYDYSVAQVIKHPNLDVLRNAGVCSNLIDVIESMLNPEPDERPTIKECIDKLYSFEKNKETTDDLTCR